MPPAASSRRFAILERPEAGGWSRNMIELESYVAGKWTAGTGKHATLVNPSTEEPVAKCSTEGVDFPAAMAFARKAGESFRATTFAARGEMIRAVSRALHAHRDELIGLAIANGGNTRSD